MKKNIGCALAFLIFVVVVILNAIQKDPQVAILVVLAVALIVFFVRFFKRENLAKAAQTHLALADILENLSNRLGLEINSTLSLNPGEVIVYKLNQVGLTEYVSSGSTYSGGTQGVSIRIAKGLAYNVGASSGSLTKNPEELTIIDSGVAYFTNQRVVFAGPKQSREWLFSKVLNVDVTGNGVNLALAVSNRQKTSGLVWQDKSDLTPGVAIAIAMDYSDGGLEKAKARCVNTAKAFRAIAQGTTPEDATAIANPEANL
jgi:hypothetical protein